MKRIWNEQTIAGYYTIRWWQPDDYDMHYGRQYAGPKESTKIIQAGIQAWWDKPTGTLRVDLRALGPEYDWMPDHRVVLETFSTRENALRRVVVLADGWTAEVRDAIPPSDERTPEELQAEYEKEQHHA